MDDMSDRYPNGVSKSLRLEQLSKEESELRTRLLRLEQCKDIFEMGYEAALRFAHDGGDTADRLFHAAVTELRADIERTVTQFRELKELIAASGENIKVRISAVPPMALAASHGLPPEMISAMHELANGFSQMAQKGLRRFGSAGSSMLILVMFEALRIALDDFPPSARAKWHQRAVEWVKMIG